MTTSRPPSTRAAAACVAVYAACVAVYVACWLAAVALPPVMLLRWRESRLAELSAGVAQADWDRFRADMQAESAGAGPVQRKVRRSPEPPERVWLRDYPSTVVAAWVLFVGLLGAVFGMMLLGAARSGTPRPPAARDTVSGPG